MTREKNKKKNKQQSEEKNYTMAVAVRLTKVEAYRIRKYEEGGLLNPERTSGNQRLFSDNDIEIIKQSAKLENEGINVEGIKAILAMRKGERQ